MDEMEQQVQDDHLVYEVDEQEVMPLVVDEVSVNEQEPLVLIQHGVQVEQQVHKVLQV